MTDELSSVSYYILNLLPMKTAVDLWSNINAMELPSSHIPSLLEPFLIDKLKARKEFLTPIPAWLKKHHSTPQLVAPWQ